jgi:hypothetical protein
MPSGPTWPAARPNRSTAAKPNGPPSSPSTSSDRWPTSVGDGARPGDQGAAREAAKAAGPTETLTAIMKANTRGPRVSLLSTSQPESSALIGRGLAETERHGPR